MQRYKSCEDDLSASCSSFVQTAAGEAEGSQSVCAGRTKFKIGMLPIIIIVMSDMIK